MHQLEVDSPPVYKIGSVSFFQAYLVHMRPYLLFVSGIAGCAGLAISSSTLSLAWYALAFASFFLGYGFGQALTDCFQIDTDAISSPYRPLVRGIISKNDVLIVSASGLIFIGVVLSLLNLFNLPLLLLSAVGLLCYTYFKKNHWYLGPFWNSWIVMLLPVAGYLAARPAATIAVALSDKYLICLCVMTFMSYANFVLIGYLKDIEADRQTSYKTFPVVFGWTKTVWVGNINVAVSIASCFWLLLQIPNTFGLFLGVCASLIAIAGQTYGLFTKEKNEANSSFTVAATVRSFILWHLSVIVSFKPQWQVTLAAIIFYLAFELVIYKRPHKNQI